MLGSSRSAGNAGVRGFGPGDSATRNRMAQYTPADRAVSNILMTFSGGTFA